MSRLLAQLCFLLVLLPAGIADAAQQQQSLGRVCEPRLGNTDTHVFHHPPDANGNDVDIWCVRGYFWSYYNFILVISRPGGNRTVGGCFFPRGQNATSVTRDGAGNFTGITWTNTDPDNPGDSYVFWYDFAANQVTITKTIDGETTEIGPIDAPEDLDELEEIIEDPQGAGCSLDLSNTLLGFTDAVGTVTITVRDSLTGRLVNKADVHIKDVALGWELVLATNDQGIVTVDLGGREYSITPVITAFSRTFSGRGTVFQMTGDRRVDLEVLTLGVPGHLTNLLSYVLALVVVAVAVFLYLVRRRTTP